MKDVSFDPIVAEAAFRPSTMLAGPLCSITPSVDGLPRGGMAPGSARRGFVGSVLLNDLDLLAGRVLFSPLRDYH
jgi:hypothetical protein